MHDDDKRRAAEAAIGEVRPGMLVGLGTGSTAAFAIEALGRLVRDGLSIRAVATSQASEALARSTGIDVIDGVDEIDPRFRAIKGAGGAMLREKAVAAASRRMIVIADGSKRVDRIGAAKLPVEVLPFARTFVAVRLTMLFDAVVLREDGGSTYLTDNGNVVFDCRGWRVADPSALATTLAAIPGAIGHGLFLTEIDAAYLSDHGVVTRVERRVDTR